MTLSFNLIDQPWLPCLRTSGEPVELSLAQAFKEAPHLREIAGESPLVTAALHRLLLAILHRLFGPANRRAWATLWGEGWPPEVFEAYFERHYQAFDLFHPDRPFYQVANPPGKPKTLNTLSLDWATGNNATLFDHTLDNQTFTISAAAGARYLITLQTFHLAGLAGGGLPNFSDTPWARGAIFLAQGKTLFETLMFNLIRYDEETPLPWTDEDALYWEQADPFTPRDIPMGYLDYLTWPARQIKLSPRSTVQGLVIDELWLAQGLGLASGGDLLEPMRSYYKHDKKGFLFIRFNENKAMWRNSDVLLQLSTKNKRPAYVNWLANLTGNGILDQTYVCHTMALGMANDQAKIHFYQHQTLPLPLQLLNNEGLLEHLRNGLQIAEQVGQALYFATKTTAMWMASPEDKNEAHKDDYTPIIQTLGIEKRYWSRLGIPFDQFVVDLPEQGETALNTWLETLKGTARTAFTAGTASLDDPFRALKGVVHGQRVLNARLTKLIPPPEV